MSKRIHLQSLKTASSNSADLGDGSTTPYSKSNISVYYMSFEIISDWIFHDFSIYQTSLPAAPTPLTEEMTTRGQAQMKAANTFRESSIFSGLKGGWRVAYERLGRLASIQNTIPKTSSHQFSFWEETAHYFGVGMG